VRRAVLVGALLLASACGGSGKPAVGNVAARQGEITLSTTPPAVGDKWTEDKTQSMQLTISAAGQKIPMVGGEHEVKTIEVLEVTDGVVTKARITYATLDRSQKVGDKEQLPPSVLAGKTYVVEAGEPLSVSTEAGPAPDAEAAEVRDAEKNFGKPEKMGKMLDGKTFVKDEPVEFPASEIAQAMGDDPTMVVTRMGMTYRGMDGALALFDMNMVMEQTTPGGKLVMDLTGKAIVEPKRNDLVEMTMDGNLQMTGSASAEGTMRLVQTQTR
jgi:hypothetical protein